MLPEWQFKLFEHRVEFIFLTHNTVGVQRHTALVM
jgi:hypothetical protein